MMVVLTTIANVVNYVSSLVFSRLLEPVGFGELTSLLALSVVLAVPLGAAQTVVAERIATAHAAGDMDRVRYLIRLAVGHVTALGLVAGALYVVCIPLVVSALDLRQPGPAIALTPLVVLTFVNPVTMGVLQGMERFAAFGVVLAAIALSRIAFGVPWVLAGGGAGGAILGQAMGMAAVTAAIVWRYRHHLLRRGTGAATRGLRRRLDIASLTASGAFVAFALLSNFDLILARLFLNGQDAGIYAAVSTVGKVVIFLPSAVAVFMVPRAAKAQASTGSSLRVLRISTALVAAGTLAFAIPAALEPKLIVRLMFGAGYEAAAPGVLPTVIAGAELAVLNLLCVYSVAIRDRRWMGLLVFGVAIQVTSISLLHASPAQIALAQAVTAGIVLLVNEALFHSLLPRRRRAQRAPT